MDAVHVFLAAVVAHGEVAAEITGIRLGSGGLVEHANPVIARDELRRQDRHGIGIGRGTRGVQSGGIQCGQFAVESGHLHFASAVHPIDHGEFIGGWGSIGEPAHGDEVARGHPTVIAGPFDAERKVISCGCRSDQRVGTSGVLCGIGFQAELRTAIDEQGIEVGAEGVGTGGIRRHGTIPGKAVPPGSQFLVFLRGHLQEFQRLFRAVHLFKLVGVRGQRHTVSDAIGGAFFQGQEHVVPFVELELDVGEIPPDVLLSQVQAIVSGGRIGRVAPEGEGFDHIAFGIDHVGGHQRIRIRTDVRAFPLDPLGEGHDFSVLGRVDVGPGDARIFGQITEVECDVMVVPELDGLAGVILPLGLQLNPHVS